MERKVASLHELFVKDGEILRRKGSDSAEPHVVPQARVRDGLDAEVRIADAAAVKVQRPLHGGWLVLLHACNGGFQQPDVTAQGGFQVSAWSVNAKGIG